MSLQFIFGNSGSGKSDFLYDSVLKQAKENKEQQFLIIVPEQFTMQTQKTLVEMHPGKGILNIDITQIFDLYQHKIKQVIDLNL